MNLSPRGLRAFRTRLASLRQRSDMVTLAHIKEQSRLSLGSYGRPRMTEELKEIGLDIGHRRVGRLMRQNGISVIRTRKHKATTIAQQAIAKQYVERAPYRPWQPILFTRLSEDPAPTRIQCLDERQGKLL